MPLNADAVGTARDQLVALLQRLKTPNRSSVLEDDPEPGLLTRHELHDLLDAMLDLGTPPLRPDEARLLLVAGNVLLNDACAPLRPKQRAKPKDAATRRALFVQALAQTPNMLPGDLRRDIAAALMALNMGRTPDLLEPSPRKSAIEAKQGIEQSLLMLIEFFVGCGHPRKDVREDALETFGITEPTLRAWKRQMLKDNPGRSWNDLVSGLQEGPKPTKLSREARDRMNAARTIEFQELATKWRAQGGASRKPQHEP